MPQHDSEPTGPAGVALPVRGRYPGPRDRSKPGRLPSGKPALMFTTDHRNRGHVDQPSTTCNARARETTTSGEIMECYRCGSEDHLYRDCPEPSRSETVNRAWSFDDHMGRIDEFCDLWFDGTFTISQKRKAIAAENLLWYGHHVTRSGVELTRA